MDMVCDKRPDVVHDFSKDPLKLFVDGEWLKAEGTTLGADNGIGVAAAMALLADKSLNLDAVTICTYNRQHAAPAIYALNNGINVLLEKPFTVTLDEAVAICRAEKKSGKTASKTTKTATKAATKKGTKKK